MHIPACAPPLGTPPSRKATHAAVDEIGRGKLITVIDGVGYPAVGSICGISNADIASAVGASVLLVGKSGVGDAVDSFNLNATLYMHCMQRMSRFHFWPPRSHKKMTQPVAKSGSTANTSGSTDHKNGSPTLRPRVRTRLQNENGFVEKGLKTHFLVKTHNFLS